MTSDTKIKSIAPRLSSATRQEQIIETVLALAARQSPGLITTQAIADAALEANPEVIVLCHGGPIATPEDAEYVMTRTSATGFVGASSMERLPVEDALVATTAAFKSARIA